MEPVRKTKETDQAKLFEFYTDSETQLIDGLRSLNRRIPFSQTTNYTHGIHPYVAKFMPQYPNLFLRLLTKENETVLDPMCGSGTTLIESVLNERQALGIDIDPLSQFISKVATRPISDKKFSIILDEWWQRVLKGKEKVNPKNYDLEKVPNHHLWFRDDILASIFYIRDEIELIDDSKLCDVAKMTLSRIIKVVSNADPRDVMPEINHEFPINEKADVFESFAKSLDFTVTKIKEFSKRIKSPQKISAKIIGNDARKINLQNDLVDLIFTSPPYAYAMDYGRMHKFSLFTILGYTSEDVRSLSKEYVGTDRVSMKEEFELIPELEFAKPFLKTLEAKNKRRSLSLHKYLIDMYKITSECARVLKVGGHFVYVIGNSTLAKNQFSTANALQRFGESVGLETKLTFERPYYMRKMGSKRAAHSAVTKSDLFIVFTKN